LLAFEMAVAIWKVHSGGGYMAVHIYEFPLVWRLHVSRLQRLEPGEFLLIRRCTNQA